MEDLHRKSQNWSSFISDCFGRSSRQDQLIRVVQERIETGIWYPCLHDLDNWSDWERFAALELLVTVIGLHEEKVQCHLSLLNFSQL